MTEVPAVTGGALRLQRRDLALEVTRCGSALVAISSLAGREELRASLVLHLAVLLVSVVVLLRVVRAPASPRLALLMTSGTLVAAMTAGLLWHDVPGGGSALGVLALIEAAVRYGMRGALASGGAITAMAVLLPQVDRTGAVPDAWNSLLLITLLLVAAVWLRHGGERAAAGAERVERAVADALSSLPVGVVVLDAEGAVVHRNARWTELVGDDEDALLADPPGETVWAGRVLALGRATTGDGSVVVHVQDVTAARAETAELAQRASTDRLTGLVARARGEDEVRTRSGALLFVDLDGVKTVNDVWGHAVGDVVLAEVAHRLRAQLRAEDVAVRWGGDEFVLLLDDGGPETAAAVAERVRRAVRVPVAVPGGTVRVTASVGLALPDDGGDAVSRADSAMYVAKRAGGDRVVLAGPPVPV